MNNVEISGGRRRTIVGESPVWDEHTGRLYWVDIIGKTILSFDPATSQSGIWETPDFPTAIGLCDSRNMAVIAFAGGVSLWEVGTNRFVPFATIDDDPPGNRLNDGAVGPDGAFWVGTMQTNLNPDGSMRDIDRSSGALYRIGVDGSVRRITPHEFGISNTLAWNEAHGTMIFGDTLRHTLFRLDWPVGAGMPELREWAVTNEHGFPDGSCMDDKGFLWNARYAGGRLLRYSSDGVMESQVELPATNITACTFGGKEFSTLFVTTATNELSPEDLQNPCEGALLALDVGVSGPRTYRFGV